MSADLLDYPDCPLCGGMSSVSYKARSIWWFKCVACRFQFSDNVPRDPEDMVAWEWSDMEWEEFRLSKGEIE